MNLEDMAIEIENIGSMLSTVSLLVIPIDTDINGEGVPSHDSIQGTFSGIVEHLNRIAVELRCGKGRTE